MDLSVAWDALIILFDLHRFLILCLGVVIGLSIGIVPGLGGIVGLAILIPFTYPMSPETAFAFLISLHAVTSTSDVIPAVLFGVPGTVGCAATVLDGHALAKQGQAGRALGACYASSLLGGLFGAVLLAVSIPILRPVMLYIGSPELLAFCIFGLSMVAVLSGNAPLKGMTAGGLGLMIAMIGSSPQTGTLRWTFGQLYMWDSLPLVPITLGIFALPELADLMINRTEIAKGGTGTSGYSLAGQRVGLRDALGNWWLVLRCSWLGATLGAVPGIGHAVIDWIAYGHALRTERNTERFGHGDIRGVIAAEASANAKEGGALVPTIAFGVPAGAAMAILLGAFLMHGLVPGPEMLTTHLSITYSIMWSLVLAHAIAVVICVIASGELARLANLRFTLLLPTVLSVAFIGAYQGAHSWGDLVSVLGFGMVGWIMKRLGWPRPPLILGVVIGEIFERYLFISIGRYGWEWMSRPVVMVLLAMAAISILRALRGRIAAFARGGFDVRLTHARLDARVLFSLGALAIIVAALASMQSWPLEARIVPGVAACLALVFALFNLAMEAFGPAEERADSFGGPIVRKPLAAEASMPEPAVIRRRALLYFAWLGAFAAAIVLIGFLPAIFVFVLGFMRIEGREPWPLALSIAGGTMVACWALFDRVLAMPWPHAILADWVPALRETGLL